MAEDYDDINEQHKFIEKALKTAVNKENVYFKSSKITRSKKKLTKETWEIIEKREQLNRIRNKTPTQKIEHCEVRKLATKKIKEDLENYENNVIKKHLESSGSTKKNHERNIRG